MRITVPILNAETPIAMFPSHSLNGRHVGTFHEKELKITGRFILCSFSERCMIPYMDDQFNSERHGIKEERSGQISIHRAEFELAI
jgi:hypothetical protein